MTNKKAPEKFGLGTRTVEYAVAVIKDAPSHGQTGTLYCRNGDSGRLVFCLSLPLRPLESNATIRQKFDASLFECLADCYAGAPMLRLALL